MKMLHVISAAVSGTGFTRTDLLAVLAGAGLLVATILPRLAAAEPQAERQTCLANLRQLGSAIRSWAGDHRERVPWTVPQAEGGSHGVPAASMVWYQSLWLTNYLSSPRFLACPSDQVRTATFWSRDPDRGLIHGSQRGNSVSYFLGLDVQADSPDAFLAGDRNLRFSARAQKCDYAGLRSAASLRPGDPTVVWSRGLHGEPGNILFYDGRAESLSTAEVQAALPKTKAVHADNHCLPAR